MVRLPSALADSWFYTDGHLTLPLGILCLASGLGWIIAGRIGIGLALMVCRWALLLSALALDFFCFGCLGESCSPGFTAFAIVALIFQLLVSVAMPLVVAMSIVRFREAPVGGAPA